MRKITIGFIILLVILIVNSFIIERYIVSFPEIEIKSEKIPIEFNGYRIAIVSDLHYGFLDPEIWIRYVINATNNKDPDLIVGVGDYVKKRETKTELYKVWELLGDLKAKDGVYFVNGNHDHWANNKLSLELLEKSGKSLRYKNQLLNKENSKIALAGVGDYWEDKKSIDSSLKGIDPEIFKIVLSHNPDFSEEPHIQKIDLFITGHTHGGQVRIPFIDYSPIIPVKNKNFDRGLKKNKFGEIIFISSGIGWSIIPIRFNCRAEIPIIVLRSK